MNSITQVARKLFGTQNDRELKSIHPLVDKINQLEGSFKSLTTDQLKAKTGEFKERISRGETLDALLPEAYSAMREAAVRTLGMRHYDVQMIGGITLHRGRIAEMKTGEGKTLVATLPCYLNALSGKGVHVVTVNDYLARRDAEWMGQVHRFMGLDVGIIVHGLNDRQRKENYGKDITYGTNNEYGFDYLRDNMKFRLDDYVQRELNFAIVDEVDSILIDEARTPLIISGPTDDSTDLYYRIDSQIRADGGLSADTHFTVDEKSKTAALTEAGVEVMEKRLQVENLYDPINIELLHHVNQALRAHVLYKKDVDYVVRDGEVLIVDEFTGRLMPGRRWSDGLHQAIEAKEGADIENENQTLASITFQNYFRMYNKLSGMTGTADTEAREFKQIYSLDVTVIPTNKPIQRSDDDDVIYKSYDAKRNAIVEHVQELNKKGQPILVGTISVEKSEDLSQAFKTAGIKHNVLNAKQHSREAEVVAQAGRKGSVTIATNMAGRGTDIVLGGNAEALAKAEVGTLSSRATEEEEKQHEESLVQAQAKWKQTCTQEAKEVKELGGLFILGTERHESRRIDNQLRGRSGRQGDPGASKFYLSLEDDLMRIFGGTINIQRFMEDDVPIEHRWINRAIENAQKKVEGHNYDVRKHLLEYDDVMNQQRKVVYTWRREVLGRGNLKEMYFSMIQELASAVAHDFFPNGKLPKKNGRPHLDMDELNDALTVTFSIPTQIEEKDIHPFNDKGLHQLILKLCEEAYTKKERDIGEEPFREIEKMILLTTIDSLWKDHLLAMDHLREGIGLRGYGQKDPLVEYKKEGYRFFEMMMNQITGDVVRKVFAVQMGQLTGSEEEFEDEDAFFEKLMRSGHGPRQMQYNVDESGELVPNEGFAPLPGGAPSNGNPFPSQGLPPELAQSLEGVDLSQLSPAERAQLQQMQQMMQRGPAKPLQKIESGIPKVGRNDPCPCGSGKKYKKCHGS